MNSIDDIIEQFGGLRPMSAKTNIPVTTIQGWKKRGRIPEKRHQDIQDAAQRHDIELTSTMDFIKPDKAPPKKRTAKKKSAPVVEKPSHVVTEEKQNDNDENGDEGQDGHGQVKPPPLHQSRPSMTITRQDIMAMEKRLMTKNLIIIGVLTALIILAFGVLLWPIEQRQNPDIEALSRDVQSLNKDVQAVRQTIANQSVSTQTNDDESDMIARQFESLKNTVEDSARTFAEATQDKFAGDFESIRTRLQALENQDAAIPGFSNLETFYLQTREKMTSAEGQAVINNALVELANLYRVGTDPERMDAAITEIKSQSYDVGTALENVPEKDVQAAVYLLALTKMRATLNRENKPFEADYALLKTLAAERDPALAESLDRLAPAAESGVLSPEGLREEFKTISGDLMVAKLSGEDVSIKDQAKARLNAVLSVEKNGELISGTPEQAAIVAAQKQLDSGDVQGAIRTLEAVKSNDQTIDVFIAKAQETISAQETKRLINQAMKALGLHTSTSPYRFDHP